MGRLGGRIAPLLAALLLAGCVALEDRNRLEGCPPQASGAIEGTWGPGGASTGRATGNDEYLWRPTEVRFEDAGYDTARCLRHASSLVAHLNWTNDPQHFGELGIGLGPDDERPSHVQDGQGQVEQGAREESLLLDETDLRDAGIRDAGTLFLGPATGTGYFAPGGMPYRLDFRVGFTPPDGGWDFGPIGPTYEGPDAPGASVPAAGVGVLLLGAAGAALARTRER